VPPGAGQLVEATVAGSDASLVERAVELRRRPTRVDATPPPPRRGQATANFNDAPNRMTLNQLLQKVRKDPGAVLETGRGLLVGQYYGLKFKLLGRRVVIGRFFRVSGPLDIRGPGRVEFGDFCTVASSRLRPTTPYTHSPDAVIRFGNRVMLTRTR